MSTPQTPLSGRRADRLSGDGAVVVGGGLAGLAAAITLAEQGVPVELHDAGRTLGGHARSSEAPFIANFGPHAIYGDGEMLPWLKAQRCVPKLVRPPATGFRVRLGGRNRRLPMPLLNAIIRLTGEAPTAESFADWAGERARPAAVHAAIGMASLPCFHPDPGELSAAFVTERLRRVTKRATAVRYVKGGWTQLVEKLTGRAKALGVEIRTSSFVAELPGGPVVLACGRRGAERLLGATLSARTTRVALLDVGLRGKATGPFALLDLDERSYVACYSRADRSLSLEGHELVQASLPLGSAEDLGAGTARLQRALDIAQPGWRDRVSWEHSNLSDGATGSVDGPGEQWADRPAIEHGPGVYLAGDYVAAPGMLGEVAWASGVSAGLLAARFVGAEPASAKARL